MDILHGPVFGNGDLEADCALYAGLFSERGINGRNLRNQIESGDVCADPDGLRIRLDSARRRRGRWRRRRRWSWPLRRDSNRPVAREYQRKMLVKCPDRLEKSEYCPRIERVAFVNRQPREKLVPLLIGQARNRNRLHDTRLIGSL